VSKPRLAWRPIWAKRWLRLASPGQGQPARPKRPDGLPALESTGQPSVDVDLDSWILTSQSLATVLQRLLSGPDAQY